MISNVFSVIVCSVSFLYSSYILYHLIYFLSNHNDYQKTDLYADTDENIVVFILWSLLTNASLLSVFMLQHSLMATDFVKQVYFKLHIQDVERSIYNVCSTAALHLLLIKWQPIPWVSLWDIDTSYNNTLWLLFTAFHVLGWSVIYSGCLMMDISELAGLKQVYYKLMRKPSPMTIKSRELRRYYAHMRHPSFTGFLMILWIHPFMTIDRALLASMLTMYMVLMWNIDKDDCNYHANIVTNKQREVF